MAAAMLYLLKRCSYTLHKHNLTYDDKLTEYTKQHKSQIDKRTSTKGN